MPRLVLSPVFLLSALAFAQAPNLRLDDSVRPVRYAADLTLLTDRSTFPGTVDIDVELRKPSALIWINSTEIAIRDASVTSGTRTQKASVEKGNDNFVGLRLPAAAPAGAARIHIVYEGKVSDRDSAGVFRGKDGSESYLYTQFESTDARRAFPCFDQPDFKTPWQLTLHVKQSDKAIANTPQASEAAEPNGMKKVVFVATKPLPSYLVAFAVGPFDIVDAGKTGRNQVPVRIITPKGKADQAKYAAEVTGTIIQQLENYFNIPFPFEKADQVAIPLTFGFGAMENAGMVTYAQTIILRDPSRDTIQRQRNYASIAAHELAHQWFGDLVTLAWWDDTWLNEAFATWTASRVLADWKPEWKPRLGDLSSKFGAMSQDSLVSTRKIRQPIESMDDISNAFDDITYEKGSAVIRMFETWVGEKQFQAGVTSYLNRYAYKNANVNDFLDAISRSGQPRLTRAFSTFLEQPGFPQISVALKCDGGPRVALTQKRFLPIGSTGARSEVWQVPVCVRYPSSGGTAQECFLLDKPAAEFPLTKAAACPAYLVANDHASGYYVTDYQGDLLTRLLDRGGEFLDAAERRTLVRDLNVLAEAGEAKESTALDAVPRFAKDPERQVVAEAQNTAASVRPLVPANLMPNYARFILSAFGAKAAQLGWSAKPGEDSETRLQRASLVPFVANRGQDPALRAEARRLADGWLKDRKGVDPDMLGSVLSTAAITGDRALFATMLSELKKIDDRAQRQLVIGALGSFRDPKLAEAGLGLILAPDLDARETTYLLFGQNGEPSTQMLAFEFVKAHYDELVKRLPSGGGSDAGALLPFVGGGFCSESARKEFVAFFEDRVKNFTGGPRNYAQTLEGIKLCEAQKAAHSADLNAFLSRQ
jgi:cytosol alanyl aminopeptidase